MSLAGRLEEVELAELLHFLALNKRTGRLTLSRRDGHGLVVLQEGRIVYAASSSIRETLGNILVRHGHVTPGTLAIALERQHASGDDKRLGHYLLEMGSLTEAQLNDVLAQQTRIVAQELCRWRTGYFRFQVATGIAAAEIGVEAEDLMVSGGVDTDRILLEAMAQLEDGEAEPDSTARSIADAALSPSLRAETTVELLRRATTVVGRGLLFVVRGDEVHGAGQFGLDGTADADDLARSLRLSLGDPSIVSAAVERRETWRGPVPETPADEHLLDRLGGARPTEAMVIPMLLRDGVGLVFYGDDLPSRQPLGPPQELEWALLEAGLAMERDLLEERIQAFEEARGRRP